MNHHPVTRGKVMLTAWVAPDVRELIRSRSKTLGLPMSEIVELAVTAYFRAPHWPDRLDGKQEPKP